ncbi:MAG: DUF433 domain-containing protein [Bacteroidota bacterium]
MYTRAEAARLVRVSSSTMEGWVAVKSRDGGRRMSEPVIKTPEEGPRLSFNNLIESWVLKLLRTKHDVSLQAVRRAVYYAESTMGVDRLLMRRELRFGEAGDLFWDKYSDLVNLTKQGQYAMRQVVERGLRRVEWDEGTGLPVRFFPIVAEGFSDYRTVVIDPLVAFGRPSVAGIGITTWAVADRIEAGEEPRAVADDYDLTPDQVEAAFAYEQSV